MLKRHRKGRGGGEKRRRLGWEVQSAQSASVKNLRLSSVETASHASVVSDEDGWMGSMRGTAEPPRVAVTRFFFPFSLSLFFRQDSDKERKTASCPASYWNKDFSVEAGENAVMPKTQRDINQTERFQTTVFLVHTVYIYSHLLGSMKIMKMLLLGAINLHNASAQLRLSSLKSIPFFEI